MQVFRRFEPLHGYTTLMKQNKGCTPILRHADEENHYNSVFQLYSISD
jgi:hypothetical protein